jgi:hypothetical protein
MRYGDCDFDEMMVFNDPLSSKEIYSIYENQNPNTSSAFIKNEKYLFQTRAIFDEGTGWMTDEGASKTIARIKKAGFNVYIPCIWHGRGTRYPSKIAPPEKDRQFEKADPLERLITIAHESDIEVHPWFCVTLRQRDFLKDYYDEETPSKAFDIHRPHFRRFIVDLISDVVKRYDVDGINLDYIRSMGVCKCSYCKNEYSKVMGRTLLVDLIKSKMRKGLDPHLQEWQENAVESIVREISSAVRRLKPGVIISVDGHPVPSFMHPNEQGRREIIWANKDLIDIIFSMDYQKNPDFENHQFVRTELNNPTKLIPLLGNYDKSATKKIISRDANLLSILTNHALTQYPECVGIYCYSTLNDSQIYHLAQHTFHYHTVPHWRWQKKISMFTISNNI